jgi:N-acetylneuraminate synthase/N,N'-diacetyllegionaminate synthase
MKIGVIVLCRHNSSRLPGKILKQINGRAVLGHIVDRIRRGVEDLPVVIATSTDPSDDVIETYCRRAGLNCFRGSLKDVAGRFSACAEKYGWDFAVRINGDNLFVDKDVLRAMVAVADTNTFDFVTNVPGRTFPRGMSVEIVRVSFYSKLMKVVSNPGHREHVTSWLYENIDLGRRYIFENRICPEAANFQLALDTENDFRLAAKIFSDAGSELHRLNLRGIYQLATQVKPASPWCGRAGPLMIAEIGGNHEGNFAVAKALTEQAIESGVDCVKFQIYRGDTLVSPIESPDRYKHFQRFELLPEQHIELAEMCRIAGVKYLSSVWDMAMLGLVDSYMDIYKVGSGDMTAWPILRELAQLGKPILLSTGLATLDEIIHTVEYIQRIQPLYKKPEWLCLLQCTSMYPIPDSDAELRVMDVLRESTGLTVGYSDHTVGSNAIRAAVAKGARVIEFHFTDIREGKQFRDHQVSLTPNEVRDLMRDVAQITTFLGSGVKVPQDSELVSGHHVSFRRGVYVNRKLRAGEYIKESDLVFLRPAHGTDAREYENVVGAQAICDIEPFKGIICGEDYSR